MQIQDIQTYVSILLGIASTTLAIAAFIFSWISFRNTSKMQIDAQSILAQISQKVEVVVERTSHQMDRAWEYFTGAREPSSVKQEEELKKQEEELRKKIVEEAKQEVTELLKKVGLDPDTSREVVQKVENVIQVSTEKTKEIIDQEKLIIKLVELDELLNEIALIRGFQRMPDGLYEMKGILPFSAINDIKNLYRIHKALRQGEFDSRKEELPEYFFLADSIINFLESFKRRRKN